MAPPLLIKSGDTFSRLTVIERIPTNNGNPRWRCRCQCGEITDVYGGNLRTGKVKSCGCLRRERAERVIQAGYAFITRHDHPRANKRTGRVREHIVVMEQQLGRYLLPDEEVHHKNTDRSDNDPRNLELWTRSHPSGSRVSDKVEWAVNLLRLYAPELLQSTTL